MAASSVELPCASLYPPVLRTCGSIYLVIWFSTYASSHTSVYLSPGLIIHLTNGRFIYQHNSLSVYATVYQTSSWSFLWLIARLCSWLSVYSFTYRSIQLLFIYLDIHPSVGLSACYLSDYLSYFFIHPSMYLLSDLPFQVSTFLLFIHPPIYLWTCLSIFLPIDLNAWSCLCLI